MALNGQLKFIFHQYFFPDDQATLNLFNMLEWKVDWMLFICSYLFTSLAYLGLLSYCTRMHVCIVCMYWLIYECLYVFIHIYVCVYVLFIHTYACTVYIWMIMCVFLVSCRHWNICAFSFVWVQVVIQYSDQIYSTSTEYCIDFIQHPQYSWILWIHPASIYIYI